MLKLILILLLIAFFFPQQQTPPRAEPDVVATNFSWIKQSTRLIRGAQNPGGTITPPMVAEDRSLGSRKAELRNTDKQAAISADEHGNTYHLFVEFKNTGTNIIRSVVWEFRPTALPDDYAAKQYLCLMKVKPNQKKKIDLWTPFAPVKVITVKIRPEGLKDGDVVVNKIEYADGSVWKRSDWRYSLPANATESLSEGKCSIFDS